MRGKAAADMRFEAHQRAHRGARHVDDVVAVEHRERGRIAGQARELFQVRLRQMLDVHRLEVGGAELEHLRAQQELPPPPRDVAELLERQQATAGGCGRHAGDARDLGQRQRRVVAREHADHGEALGEAAHGLAAKRRVLAARHDRSLFRYAKKQKRRARALDSGRGRRSACSTVESLFGIRNGDSGGGGCTG